MTRVHQDVGSNPNTGYWMDIFNIHLLYKLYCLFVCLKRPKINEKEAGRGPFKKKKCFIVMAPRTAARSFQDFIFRPSVWSLYRTFKAKTGATT